MSGAIFMSYRRVADPWAINLLHQRLCDAFGRDDVFFDTRTLPSGALWEQGIGRAIADASVVVVVFCHEWYGTRADGTRRIDDADDPVRKELRRADGAGKPVIPVVIDHVEQPKKSDLPDDLQFLRHRQFKRLSPGPSIDAQLNSLISNLRNQIHGSRQSWRIFGQVIWIALLVSAIVTALHSSGAGTPFDDAFARTAQGLRSNLAFAGPDDVALMEISDDEFRELFGGRLPLDPEVMSIVITAIDRLSREVGSCQPDRPVGINLDLSPGSAHVNDSGLLKLNRAVFQLSSCRPVVLTCPQSIERRAAWEDDAKWVATMRRNAPRQALHFSNTLMDPTGLRGSTQRWELGLMLADIASGTRPRLEDSETTCACPHQLDTMESCAPDTRHLPQWDRRFVAVPFQSTSFHNLSSGLTGMKVAVSNRFLMLGGAFGGQGRLPLTARDDAPQGVTGTVAHSYLLNGALNHRPLRWPIIGVALLGFAAATIVSALMLLLGAILARYKHRFSHRIPAYLLAGVVMIAIPLGALLAAARWPALSWIAALGFVTCVLATARSGLACFELLINGGVAWKSPLGVWQALRFDQDKASALLRLAAFLFEAALIALCVVLVLQSRE